MGDAFLNNARLRTHPGLLVYSVVAIVTAVVLRMRIKAIVRARARRLTVTHLSSLKSCRDAVRGRHHSIATQL